MPIRSILSVVLVVALTVSFATPARAESLQTAGKQIVAGIVIVSVAVGAGIALLIVHEKRKKSAITGCVISGASGLSVTDEKDKRTYALTGNPAGVKPGDRMALEGRRRKGNADTLVFEAHSVIRDFGACQP
jgi:hypothetical protein